MTMSFYGTRKLYKKLTFDYKYSGFVASVKTAMFFFTFIRKFIFKYETSYQLFLTWAIASRRYWGQLFTAIVQKKTD